MKFTITKEWLARKLAHIDDTSVGAGGTSLEDLHKDAQLRTVTPSVIAEIPSELGKVVRYIREQRGWSRLQLSEIASLDEAEVTAIETQVGFTPSPRAVIYLADALGLSRERLKELVGFVVARATPAANDAHLRFAAQSKGVGAVSDDEYDAVRALVELLAEKKGDGT